MKWIDYAEIDEEGNIIEVYSLPIDEEVPEQYKRVWGQDAAFFEPKWDYDNNKWIESKSKDEIEIKKKKEEEALKQEKIDNNVDFRDLSESKKDELLLLLLKDRGLV